MESGGISRVIVFLAKRPELDQCRVFKKAMNLSMGKAFMKLKMFFE